MELNTVKSAFNGTEKELRIVRFSLLASTLGGSDLIHYVACLTQVPEIPQSQFSIQSDLVPPLSNSSVFSFP
jgi:hypothetical protein